MIGHTLFGTIFAWVLILGLYFGFGFVICAGFTMFIRWWFIDFNKWLKKYTYDGKGWLCQTIKKCEEELSYPTDDIFDRYDPRWFKILQIIIVVVGSFIFIPLLIITLLMLMYKLADVYEEFVKWFKG